MERRSLILTGCAGPIVGVIEVTATKIITWRACVLCPWHSEHRESETYEKARTANCLFIAEQSEHLAAKHPEMIDQVREEAGDSAFTAQPQGMVC